MKNHRVRKEALRLTFFCLLLTGCTSQMASRSQEQANQQTTLFEEMRVALVDMKQQLSSQKLDIALLEEKLTKLKNAPDTHAIFEQRLSTLERTGQHTTSDLQALSHCTKEALHTIEEMRQQLTTLEQRLSQESERLSEVSHLRNTLHSLSKAMANSAQEAGKIHRVRVGDSLEKIARHYQTSIEEIKSINGLNSNKILVGQELKIPERP